MDVTKVTKKIKDIYERRRRSLYALALAFAAMAIRYFREVQPQTPNARGKFWHNRTGQAAARVFTKGELTGSMVSWYISHGVQYGTYLELANDRKYQALRPVIQRYAGRFLRDAQKLFKD
jgi:hypothetical protein